MLQQKIWQTFGDQFISTNALIIFSGRRNRLPSLHFMRYNFAKCTEYLSGVIKTKYPEKESVTCEAMATSYINGYILSNISVLADDFESLPDAPFNRHNVKKGKVCLCQYLEPIILRRDVNT
ncbi:uncharacterized protein LOC128552435 [Mercenaria mercenaria]|uniref:uncharacterized protein LOC128552435 n=1 Tax=Mercenaria mercenaria TaxID=6596 RepID=UPI00234E80A6|nr:uncharacterized protein LOC128552435 [Mercenaria mercenaria]